MRAVACLNAVCWSIITPPFQVPDEPEHVAYVKQLAETGRLPSRTGSFSIEETIALQDLRLQTVAEEPEYQTISAKAQQEKLQHDLTVDRALARRRQRIRRRGCVAAAALLRARVDPLQPRRGRHAARPHRADEARVGAVRGDHGAVHVPVRPRDAAARALGLDGRADWAVALVPLLGFMSGAVNPDSMLYAVTAAIFYAWRGHFDVA